MLVKRCMSWVITFATAIVAFAAPDEGRDPAKYPPDVTVDFRHIRLELDFDDPASRSFEGRATYTIRAVRPDVSRLTLDAVDLYIDGVQSGASDDAAILRFEHDGQRLTVHFAQPLPVDTDTTLSIAYRCVDPREGMIFAVPDAGYPDRPLVVHTQSETEFARYWYPCLDSPAERMTSETIVTVPNGLTVIGNGALISRDESGGTTCWHHRLDVPHVNYLLSLVIGPFEVHTDQWRSVPVEYFYAAGREDEALNTYVQTPEMMEDFSTLLGVDYPYPKYSQVNVPLFQFGGMENISATTMAESAMLDDRALLDGDLDGLVAHELAHQWFGDLITCRSWDHIWLNEGFATFVETMWTEHADGRDAYDVETWHRINGVAAADATDAGKPLVYRDYPYAFEPFFHKSGQAYGKGAAILHMLRRELDDELFWRAIRAYVEQFRERVAETEDFRLVIERVSGRSFEQFFRQWCYRPGVPKLNVKQRWLDDESLAEVTVTQTQPISAQTPAFVLPIDLLFVVNGTNIRRAMTIDGKESVWRGRLDDRPSAFYPDPDGSVLAVIEVDQSEREWIDQLASGPTIVTRLRAANELRSEKTQESVDALHECLRDRATLWSLANVCAESLGAMDTPAARDGLLAALDDPQTLFDARLRKAAVEALGRYHTREVAELLTRYARSDEAYGVEAAATTALGAMTQFHAHHVLAANAEKDSYNDQIRRAAINALAAQHAPAGIVVATKYAAYGGDDRTRPEAIRALGRLGHHETRTDAVRRTLTELTRDPQYRSRHAALEALADLGGAEAASVLRGVANGGAEPGTRDVARKALERVGQPSPESARVVALRKHVQRLREGMEKLEDRVRELERKRPTVEGR